MKRLSSLLIALLLASCASQSEFQQRYDHYFPSGSTYVEGDYRSYYDKWLFGKPPPKNGNGHLWQLYDAFHGNAAAAHLFFHHPDRDANGEYGEAWEYDCVLLLLRLGDDRFSELLVSEDAKTKEVVGAALDEQINFSRDPFTKTRALYHSHWKPRSIHSVDPRL